MELRDYRQFALTKGVEVEHSPTSTERIPQLLKSVILQSPLLAYSLFTRHIASDVNPTASRTVQTIVVDVTAQLLSQRQYEDVYYLLQFLHVVKKEELKSLLTKLFTSLIELEVERNKLPSQDEKRILRTKVFSSLISTDNGIHLLEFYTSLHDELLYMLQRKQRVEEPKVKPLEDLSLSKHSATFWHHFYNFVRANDIHFAEYVILRCLDLIQQRQYNEALDLLQPFQQLSSLVILLAWDKYKEDLAFHKAFPFSLCTALVLNRKNLTDSLKEAGVDPSISQMCRNVEYQIILSWWIFEKINSQQTDSPKSTREVPGTISTLFRDTFRSTESHSVLYTLKSWLSRINLDDLAALIESNPDKSKWVCSLFVQLCGSILSDARGKGR